MDLSAMYDWLSAHDEYDGEGIPPLAMTTVKNSPQSNFDSSALEGVLDSVGNLIAKGIGIYKQVKTGKDKPTETQPTQPKTLANPLTPYMPLLVSGAVLLIGGAVVAKVFKWGFR